MPSRNRNREQRAKQTRFVREYAVDCNGAAAAVRRHFGAFAPAVAGGVVDQHVGQRLLSGKAAGERTQHP